ncbi:MAG: metallopeptidase family protein [Phycisphaerales bacterium]|nr:metallopeptidase family protein [Phycisphaerales bacterium]
MSPELQDRFDALLEDAIDALPPAARQVIEEVPIIVEDRPSKELAESLRTQWQSDPDSRPVHAAEDAEHHPDDPNDLMGLHVGVAITEQSITSPTQLPTTIYVFREGIVSAVGGWEVDNADDEIYEEIRITLLHEIGHHFGLTEQDLEDLGYD